MDLSVEQAAERISAIHKEQPEQPEQPAASAEPDAPSTHEPEIGESETTLSEIAEALEIEPDALLQKLKTRIKVGDDEREVSLSELRDTYATGSEAALHYEEMQRQRQTFESERAEYLQRRDAEIGQLGMMLQYVEQQLLGEHAKIDWPTLRQTDPAAFSAMKHEYNDRYAQIQAIKEGLSAQIQQEAIAARQQAFLGQREHLMSEVGKLREAIPEFADKQQAKALIQDIREYLSEHGYPEERINSITDHRDLLVIRDAMKYRELKAKRVDIANRVKGAPKLLKPGFSVPTNAKARASADKWARLRKTGRVEDAAAVLRDLI